MPILDENRNILCEKTIKEKIAGKETGKIIKKRHHLNPAVVRNSRWMADNDWAVVEEPQLPPAVFEIKPTLKDFAKYAGISEKDFDNGFQNPFETRGIEVKGILDLVPADPKPKRKYRKRKIKVKSKPEKVNA